MLSPMLFILTALCFVAWLVVRRIPEGQVYTLRRVDGHTRAVGAGTHLVLPLIERIEHKIQLTGNTLLLDNVIADGHSCHGSVYFQILDPVQANAVLDTLTTLLRTRVTDLLGQPSVSIELTERRQWLKQALNAELRQYGLLITRVELLPNH